MTCVSYCHIGLNWPVAMLRTYGVTLKVIIIIIIVAIGYLVVL